MKSQFQPWQLLLLILAGWINRRQQGVIDYLPTENHILREKLGKKRTLLLQREGSEAKPYQVRQVRYVLLKHHLGEAE